MWVGTDIQTRAGVFFQARSFDGGRDFERPRSIVHGRQRRPARPGAGPLHHRRRRRRPRRRCSPASTSPTAHPRALTPPTRSCHLGRRQPRDEQRAGVRDLVHQRRRQLQRQGGRLGRTDRANFPAIAISPDGRDVYLVYNAHLDPWRTHHADATAHARGRPPRRCQPRHRRRGRVHHAAPGGGRRRPRVERQRPDAASSSATTTTRSLPGLRRRGVGRQPQRGGLPGHQRLPPVARRRRPDPGAGTNQDCPVVAGDPSATPTSSAAATWTRPHNSVPLEQVRGAREGAPHLPRQGGNVMRRRTFLVLIACLGLGPGRGCPGRGRPAYPWAARPGLRHQRLCGLHGGCGCSASRARLPQQRSRALDRRQPTNSAQCGWDLAAGPLVERRRAGAGGRVSTNGGSELAARPDPEGDHRSGGSATAATTSAPPTPGSASAPTGPCTSSACPSTTSLRRSGRRISTTLCWPASSTNGGLTWSDPVVVIGATPTPTSSTTSRPSPPTPPTPTWSTASGTGWSSPPARPPSVRACFRTSAFRGPIWFARSTNGGAVWEPARQLYDPGQNDQTIGNQIVGAAQRHPGECLRGVQQREHRQAAGLDGAGASLDRQGGQLVGPDPGRPAARSGSPTPTPARIVRTGDIIPDVAVDRPAAGCTRSGRTPASAADSSTASPSPSPSTAGSAGRRRSRSTRPRPT